MTVQTPQPSASPYSEAQLERQRHFIEEYRTPDVEAKLFQLGIADSLPEAAALLLEARRYLFLTRAYGPMTMFSALVDAAWHQFVLASGEYNAFCHEGWGTCLLHEPGSAPDPRGAEKRIAAGDTFEAFVATYQRHIGSIPDVWYDGRCLRGGLRLVRPDIHDRFFVEEEPERAVLVRERGEREVVCRTNRRLRPALEWIAHHRTFLIRELVGVRSEAERTRLLAPLVEFGVLQLAP